MDSKDKSKVGQAPAYGNPQSQAQSFSVLENERVTFETYRKQPQSFGLLQKEPQSFPVLQSSPQSFPVLQREPGVVSYLEDLSGFGHNARNAGTGIKVAENAQADVRSGCIEGVASPVLNGRVETTGVVTLTKTTETYTKVEYLQFYKHFGMDIQDLEGPVFIDAMDQINSFSITIPRTSGTSPFTIPDIPVYAEAKFLHTLNDEFLDANVYFALFGSLPVFGTGTSAIDVNHEPIDLGRVKFTDNATTIHAAATPAVGQVKELTVSGNTATYMPYKGASGYWMVGSEAGDITINFKVEIISQIASDNNEVFVGDDRGYSAAGVGLYRLAIDSIEGYSKTENDISFVDTSHVPIETSISTVTYPVGDASVGFANTGGVWIPYINKDSTHYFPLNNNEDLSIDNVPSILAVDVLEDIDDEFTVRIKHEAGYLYLSLIKPRAFSGGAYADMDELYLVAYAANGDSYSPTAAEDIASYAGSSPTVYEAYLRAVSNPAYQLPMTTTCQAGNSYICGEASRASVYYSSALSTLAFQDPWMHDNAVFMCRGVQDSVFKALSIPIIFPNYTPFIRSAATSRNKVGPITASDENLNYWNIAGRSNLMSAPHSHSLHVGFPSLLVAGSVFATLPATDEEIFGADIVQHPPRIADKLVQSGQTLLLQRNGKLNRPLRAYGHMAPTGVAGLIDGTGEHFAYQNYFLQAISNKTKVYAVQEYGLSHVIDLPMRALCNPAMVAGGLYVFGREGRDTCCYVLSQGSYTKVYSIPNCEASAIEMSYDTYGNLLVYVQYTVQGSRVKTLRIDEHGGISEVAEEAGYSIHSVLEYDGESTVMLKKGDSLHWYTSTEDNTYTVSSNVLYPSTLPGQEMVAHKCVLVFSGAVSDLSFRVSINGDEYQYTVSGTVGERIEINLPVVAINTFLFTLSDVPHDKRIHRLELLTYKTNGGL